MQMQDLESHFAQPRVTFRSRKPLPPSGPVVYWMQRAQRGRANPALDVAIAAANRLGAPVAVFFAPRPDYPGANLRSFTFLFEGIADIAADVTARGCRFVLRSPPHTSLVAFCREVGARLVVGDENPLRDQAAWRQKAADRLPISLWTVDADVVVPAKALPPGEFYAAYTLRPKIHAVLDQYLMHNIEPDAQHHWSQAEPASDAVTDVATMLDRLGPIDRSVPAVATRGGRQAGLARLGHFLSTIFDTYDTARDEPSIDGTTKISPYLHFGQISPLEVALAIRNAPGREESRNALLEQLIVRRELAIHFVARNPRYDTLQGCEPWALRTLDERRADPRLASYTLQQLERAETDDAAWNAAQLQMTTTGWMHNRMRMYWAKRLLEWTRDPETAMAYGIFLNDKYELDGRDPNGYAGIAWSVGGKHDRPWAPQRKIFGAVRYMNAAGLQRKTKINIYIQQHTQAGKAAKGQPSLL